MTGKKALILLGAVLAAVCAAVIVALGGTYTIRPSEDHLSEPVPSDPSLIQVRISEGEDCVELAGIDAGKDGTPLLRFRSVKRGKAFVIVVYNGRDQGGYILHVHPTGVITHDDYLGDSRGDEIVPAAVTLYLAALLFYFIKRYRADVKNSLCAYRNVTDLGLIVFTSFVFVCHIPLLFSYRGLQSTVNYTMGVVRYFSMLAFPTAAILSVLVTVSNVTLMKKEGRTWKNMLGTILGAVICLLTIAPIALGEYLQFSPDAIVDVHNMRSGWLYVEKFVETAASATVVYLECVLIGTIVCAVKAARHVPPFDRSHMIILGCQVARDGGLTPLLRSRVDRALEFAKEQKEAGGSDLVFVPSGGQGGDEVRAEALAMRDYLLAAGVPEDRIIVEDESTDTFENIRNSMRLIRESLGEKEPKAAFSTTNYHVFRAGLTALGQGERIEGVGSPTKRYFWVNAFIREFIATLVAERKKHLLVLAVIVLLIALTVGADWFSAVL